jgi:hypothetical protein
LFHPKVTGLFPAKSAALFNRYLLQFSIVIYTSGRNRTILT